MAALLKRCQNIENKEKRDLTRKLVRKYDSISFRKKRIAPARGCAIIHAYETPISICPCRNVGKLLRPR